MNSMQCIECRERKEKILMILAAHSWSSSSLYFSTCQHLFSVSSIIKDKINSPILVYVNGLFVTVEEGFVLSFSSYINAFK